MSASIAGGWIWRIELGGAGYGVLSAINRPTVTSNAESAKRLRFTKQTLCLMRPKGLRVFASGGLPAEQLNVPDHTAQTNSPASPADLELPVEVSPNHVNVPL